MGNSSCLIWFYHGLCRKKSQNTTLENIPADKVQTWRPRNLSSVFKSASYRIAAIHPMFNLSTPLFCVLATVNTIRHIGQKKQNVAFLFCRDSCMYVKGRFVQYILNVTVPYLSSLDLIHWSLFDTTKTNAFLSLRTMLLRKRIDLILGKNTVRLFLKQGSILTKVIFLYWIVLLRIDIKE